MYQRYESLRSETASCEFELELLKQKEAELDRSLKKTILKSEQDQQQHAETMKNLSDYFTEKLNAALSRNKELKAQLDHE